MGFSQVAEIYTYDDSVQQVGVGTLYETLLTFVSNGNSKNCINRASVGEIEIKGSGVYLAIFSVSFSGNDDTTWMFDLAINGVSLQRGVARKNILSSEIGSASFSAIISCVWGDVVSMLVKADGADKTITVYNTALTLMS